MILTIAIPTIVTRKREFEALYNFINAHKTDEVEVIYECDNKEISIGAKRQLLIDRAAGKYLVMIDDDDWIPPHYCTKIIEALKDSPDCVGYIENCSMMGQVKRSSINLKYAEWGNNRDGFQYVRTPFFKTPIRTSLCRITGCKDLRFGEDHDFAKRIYPLLHTCAYIPEELYFYRYKHEPHNEKYGIKG